MPISDPPPDPPYYRVLLRDPEGYDPVELQRLFEDSGLKVLRVEELSASEVETESKKPSEAARFTPRSDRSLPSVSGWSRKVGG